MRKVGGGGLGDAIDLLANRREAALHPNDNVLDLRGAFAGAFGPNRPPLDGLEAYEATGATIGDPFAAEIVFSVNAPAGEQLDRLKPHATLISWLSPMLNQALVDDPAFNAWVVGRTPSKRWGKPGELIGTAVFLASAASDYVNGQIIYVDGGMLAVL